MTPIPVQIQSNGAEGVRASCGWSCSRNFVKLRGNQWVGLGAGGSRGKLGENGNMTELKMGYTCLEKVPGLVDIVWKRLTREKEDRNMWVLSGIYIGFFP